MALFWFGDTILSLAVLIQPHHLRATTSQLFLYMLELTNSIPVPWTILLKYVVVIMGKLKYPIWATTEGGNLEVTYTDKEEYGVLALCGVHDAEAKPSVDKERPIT
ncbi:unnamed protein product [Eruca vesicaria subsp. sativa]|uniref:Uncharacterized protein n=1 Tax=Eruca vesicaria subsp. sativa TaxID=29727 RepID=A0ABC8ITB3_ERUVS|nr:unnamed protein product [Eruca vesicaria subsp. sativa]